MVIGRLKRSKKINYGIAYEDCGCMDGMCLKIWLFKVLEFYDDGRVPSIIGFNKSFFIKRKK